MLADSNSPDAFEFCNLQSSCEMEALFDAHDTIATEVDRIPTEDPIKFTPNDTFELMIHQNIANDNIFNVNISHFTRINSDQIDFFKHFLIFSFFKIATD